ncbi:hypothetical protein HZS_818 [Henneguya salminicola]|nr:hypothetical protein HZS_818 [Henneguya salminicola]
MKALCREKYNEWHDKFLKFKMESIEFTGDSADDSWDTLSRYQIIITTPEKWENFSRAWKNNINFMNSIKLLCVDEGNYFNII